MELGYHHFSPFFSLFGESQRKSSLVAAIGDCKSNEVCTSLRFIISDCSEVRTSEASEIVYCSQVRTSEQSEIVYCSQVCTSEQSEIINSGEVRLGIISIINL